jgi:orotate phosphoribosyltransferase
MEESKCVVTEIRCVLDRNEGGKELIKNKGYGFSAILQVVDGNLV